MIYLDNAATGGYKPQAVYETMENVTRYLSANAGRSGHRLAVTGGGLIMDCREMLSMRFNSRSERVIFTKNCTEALNIAIFGCVKRGGRVITTVYEHNSVLRPLYALQKRGEIILDIVRPTENKDVAEAIEEKILPDTYLIVTTAASNVTGEGLPINRIGSIAKKHGILYLVDGAQAGGHMPINMRTDNIDMLALAGHKGLYGVQGSGVLILDERVDLNPLTYGGTGSESFNKNQPDCYPEHLESGTLNLPAIAALKEGVRFAYSNIEHFSTHLLERTAYLINSLSTVKDCKCYSKPNRFGIVAFEISGRQSTEIADLLNSEYDIAVRGGLHCAPLMHEFLHTDDAGLVRASISAQNTARELSQFIRALKEIAES